MTDYVDIGGWRGYYVLCMILSLYHVRQDLSHQAVLWAGSQWPHLHIWLTLLTVLWLIEVVFLHTSGATHATQ